jgi:hypothetical protein
VPPDGGGLELDGRFAIGRDPRRMTRAELVELRHQPMSPLRALRLRCLDCCCDQPSEVRKCTAVKCPSWPFRMGVNPWRAEPSEAKREAARQLTARRGARAENPRSSRASGDDSTPAGPGDRASMRVEEIEEEEADAT